MGSLPSVNSEFHLESNKKRLADYSSEAWKILAAFVGADRSGQILQDWVNKPCSYIPPCARDDQENSENVTYKQKYWKEKVGSQPFTCYFNQHLRPDDVMLKRTHDETVLLHCFLWPVVTFLVGVLIVVLTICAKSLAVRAEAIKKRKH
ncbi:PREDICTED: calcium-activated potassium channel subunit beta-4, partial [Acanthisitta chloris]|uniref:calcium-activated potassium channel subunit beta-4 n=1 Tax=Acanthisitta chloris TaxID=57068 RepID=UPI0004F0C4D7